MNDSNFVVQVRREQPHKNYISLFLWIPRFLNAVWELVRGFILPLMKGQEYKEGWLLILLRFWGLVFPGLAAHNPQDYVNATRLSSHRMYQQLRDHHPMNGSYLA